MFGDVNSCITFDVAADFCSPFLGNKTAKSTDVDVLTISKGLLQLLENRFKGNKYVHFRNTRFF